MTSTLQAEYNQEKTLEARKTVREVRDELERVIDLLGGMRYHMDNVLCQERTVREFRESKHHARMIALSTQRLSDRLEALKEKNLK